MQITNPVRFFLILASMGILIPFFLLGMLPRHSKKARAIYLLLVGCLMLVAAINEPVGGY